MFVASYLHSKCNVHVYLFIEYPIQSSVPIESIHLWHIQMFDDRMKLMKSYWIQSLHHDPFLYSSACVYSVRVFLATNDQICRKINLRDSFLRASFFNEAMYLMKALFLFVIFSNFMCVCLWLSLTFNFIVLSLSEWEILLTTTAYSLTLSSNSLDRNENLH